MHIRRLDPRTITVWNWGRALDVCRAKSLNRRDD
ncbi:MAG: hypothetical protein RLY65_612, partial [Pseudomonadota bacterium]